MATDRSPRSPGSSTDEPSRAEIQQRVSSLYDRAESDTGTYNVTRAMSGRTRRTAGSVASGGRGSADPSLDAVTRQWFDVARDRMGPITPAVLPADRQPARPSRAARPASAPERSGDSAVVRELEAAARRVPELTSRAAVAALPAAPEPRRDEPKALLPAVPAPAASPDSAAASASAAPTDRQASLKNTKEQIGRKLVTAREVLARALAQPAPSLPAAASVPTSSLPAVGTQPAATPSAQSRPVQQAVQQPVEQPWDTAEQQAFRAEIAAAWAGQPSAAATGTASPTGTDGFLTTGELGFAAPASGFATPEVPFSAPTPDYPGAELGVTAPPFSFPLPGLGATAPESGFTAPGVDPLTATPGYQTAEFRVPTPPSGYAMAEPPATGPESGFTGAPVPGYQTSGLGVMAAASDILTAGSGYQAAPGSLAAPATPLPDPLTDPMPMPMPVPPVPPVAAPTDVTVSATGTAYLGKADKALAFARAQIGRPCVWGATGPESYDCSSLTQAAWRAAGVTLPRAAIDQAKDFTRISLADLRPGDLVFFFDDLSHTGLCTGNGMMIHAPGPGTYIREEAILPFGEGALRGAVRPA
ncbi:NlpC/P60 family protein [Streptomyces sp. NBC_01485]|uniref:NlpC/P60 family protein n=1 Tax=Streptomyces sp. NBC_01485 TaxID=2903884 RepID=UPI002E332FED|nr:NlpC/P60 family protein [Streptomyces sp. NBC_01485]